MDQWRTRANCETPEPATRSSRTARPSTPTTGWGERLYIDYVFSPVALRGTGASGRLMTAVAEKARKGDLRITPICGYAAAWLRRSKAFGDLVA